MKFAVKEVNKKKDRVVIKVGIVLDIEKSAVTAAEINILVKNKSIVVVNMLLREFIDIHIPELRTVFIFFHEKYFLGWKVISGKNFILKCVLNPTPTNTDIKEAMLMYTIVGWNKANSTNNIITYTIFFMRLTMELRSNRFLT